MSSLPTPFLTPKQYLDAERKADSRSEYVDGQMYAMSGASWQHGRITVNVTTQLNDQLADTQCEVRANDQRVRAKPGGPYYYPDVVVVCGKPEFEDAEFDTLLNAKLIVEVLSPSTESYDRGAKFDKYRQMQSLAEYLLISQTRVHIEHYVLSPSGSWRSTERSDPNGVLELSSIGVRLKVADIYNRVRFGAGNP
jgi:Uma2 family endonuclease